MYLIKKYLFLICFYKQFSFLRLLLKNMKFLFLVLNSSLNIYSYVQIWGKGFRFEYYSKHLYIRFGFSNYLFYNLFYDLFYNLLLKFNYFSLNGLLLIIIPSKFIIGKSPFIYTKEWFFFYCSSLLILKELIIVYGPQILLVSCILFFGVELTICEPLIPVEEVPINIRYYIDSTNTIQSCSQVE